MALAPSLLFGKIMHKRLFPKVNGFTYGAYYLAFPLSRMEDLSDGWRFGVNRPGILSFYGKDHGARDGSDLPAWGRGVLKRYDLEEADGEIILVTLPRVFGYVFNPVSFWLCLDRENALRAVICEVNNTFGETHSYLCAHDDRRPISGDDWLSGEKLFHVSPFLEREGSYKFRFALKGGGLGVWIDYYDGTGKKQLLTSVTGTLSPYSRAQVRRAFWGYPLTTFKTIFLIHWQAVKLILKGIRYIHKPEQKPEKTSGPPPV